MGESAGLSHSVFLAENDFVSAFLFRLESESPKLELAPEKSKYNFRNHVGDLKVLFI